MINVRLIDADALLEQIKNPYQWREVARWVNDAPTIEPKKGKWKDSVLGMDGYYANCSQCGYQIDVHENRGYPNYCANCGADLRGDAE